MPLVSTDIPVAATWPTTDELAARDRVVASLDLLGIGSLVGCGGGLGSMDFSYRVADAVHASEVIRQAVLAEFPAVQPQLRVTP